MRLRRPDEVTRLVAAALALSGILFSLGVVFAAYAESDRGPTAISIVTGTVTQVTPDQTGLDIVLDSSPVTYYVILVGSDSRPDVDVGDQVKIWLVAFDDLPIKIQTPRGTWVDSTYPDWTNVPYRGFGANAETARWFGLGAGAVLLVLAFAALAKWSYALDSGLVRWALGAAIALPIVTLLVVKLLGELATGIS